MNLSNELGCSFPLKPRAGTHFATSLQIPLHLTSVLTPSQRVLPCSTSDCQQTATSMLGVNATWRRTSPVGWRHCNTYQHTIFPSDFHVRCTNLSCSFILCWPSDGCTSGMILEANSCSPVLKLNINHLKVCRETILLAGKMKAKNQRNYPSLS